MDQEGIVESVVTHELKEKKGDSFGPLYGESWQKVEFTVQGSYSANEDADEVRVRLEKTKMLLEMKRRSCAVLSDLQLNIRSNMAILRQEKRELMRANAIAYRQRLRRRAH